MKVLFICKYNKGRSQIACAMFNRISKKHAGVSAGIHVADDLEKSGRLPNKTVIEVMKEIGYDISKNKRTQLTRSIADKADKIIAVMSKKEADALPSYVTSSKKFVLWGIKRDKRVEFTRAIRQVRNRIHVKVKELVKETG